MARLSQEEIQSYLQEPHVAHLVTVRPGGTPHVAPVWFLADGDQALVIAGESAVKVRNLRQNPAVSLSIALDQRPYRYVVLEGEARIIEDNLAEQVERICVRYDGPERGRAFARELLEGGGTALIQVRVNRVISWKED